MRREKLLITLLALNESPSEKEGKFRSRRRLQKLQKSPQ